MRLRAATRRLAEREAFQHSRPRLRQSGADEHHAVGAQPRFVGRGREHAEGALDVEIGEHVARGEMVEGAAQALGEQDRRTRAGDIGA